MEYYPAFSSFRELLTIWDEQLSKQQKDKIKSMLETNGFVFFFKKDDEIYAASEDSRLTFARMKNPDEETDEDWGKDAAFKAVSLTCAFEGEKKESLFHMKDLKTIKIMDKEDAYKELTKLAQEKPKKAANLKVVLSDDDYDDPNIPANQKQLGDDV